MKKLVLACMLILAGMHLFPEKGNTDTVEHSPANSKCFKCHGRPTYTYYNKIIGQNVTKRQNPYLMIDSVLFYESNHKSLECLDCHSYEYNNFPHNSELQMEPMPTCLDCHEGDGNYNFETINKEYLESIHATRHKEAFSCFMCHDPHSYKINVRSDENIEETIVYDNNICLSCHANFNKYQLISSRKNPNIIRKHNWLPNQVAHFAHVRCIECHTQTTNKVLVAHKILPKEKAVKKCVECHSQNSILMASLYKFQAKEKRSKNGFLNAAILNNDSYVIGANRNIYLNYLSLIIFGLVLLFIIIHAILRILTK